jgi:hypothetical protein
MSFSLALASPNALSAAIAQGYSTDEPQIPGSLVSLVSGQAGKVQAANSERVDGLLGVVVASNDATLDINANRGNQQVATSGSTQALVSNIGGSIKTGDHITASPIDGVGMKATAAAKVVGVAQADFDGGAGSKLVQVKTKSGQTQSFSVGSIALDLQPAYYSPQISQQTVVPSVIQNVANSLAGREVSVLRVLISSLVMLVSVLAVGVMLFAGVRSSIISIGRNPLAQVDIYRGLLQVLVTSLAIMGIASAGSYLILRA